MAKQALSSNQKTILAILALAGALLLGSFLFLSDVGSILLSAGK